MAVLIPSIGSCAGRMTSGEKRLAQRLLYVAMTRATQTLIVTTHGPAI